MRILPTNSCELMLLYEEDTFCSLQHSLWPLLCRCLHVVQQFARVDLIYYAATILEMMVEDRGVILGTRERARIEETLETQAILSMGLHRHLMMVWAGWMVVRWYSHLQQSDFVVQ